MRKKMRISVFGLGYVGTVTGACLAAEGHFVIGVDTNKDKVDAINKAKSPVLEKGLSRLISTAVKNRKLSATLSATRAVLQTDIAMVCVGTPSMKSGSIDLTHLKAVIEDIGKVLGRIRKFYTIVIRSTLLPGTTENILIPILEKTSLGKCGRDFAVCVNPEFMREGNSLEDFYSPSKTIIGISSQREKRLLAGLLNFVKAPLMITDIKTAEASKYLDNVFHGLKVCFANEAAALAQSMGVDHGKVMELFCRDKISNISSRYLKPGFAFGGSCLPKDIKAMVCKAKKEHLKVPLMESLLESNNEQIQRAFRTILKTGKKKAAILGLSFKPGTDDLRESQMVKLAELLLNKGIKLKIYDRAVSISKITGSNRAYIEKEIPHISSLLCASLSSAVKDAEVVVIGHDTREFKRAEARFKKGRIVVDIAR